MNARRLALTALAILAVTPVTLPDRVAAGPGSPAVVTFETADGSTFRAELTDAADIAAAQAALDGDGSAGIPIGTLHPGDGGVNIGHAWHMRDVTLAEVTIELCDGTATMVDENLDYWLNTVGQFCPWQATVVDVQAGGDCGAVFASTPSTGPNSVVLRGCGTAVEAYPAIETASGRALVALWALVDGRWAFAIPDAPAIDGGLGQIPTDPLAAIAVLSPGAP